MDPIIGGAIIGAAGQGLGMLGQGKRSEKAHKRNLQYMDLQHQNQQQLNLQGQQLGLDMWNATNYGAQVEHMKKAGLNPALMYGQAGQGGQSSSPSGGSASSSQAPAIQPMDMQNMLLGAQIAKLGAEVDNINADTKKKGGEVENLKANTEKALYEAFESNMRGQLDKETFDDKVKIIRQKYIKDVVEVELMKSKTELNEQQKSQLEHKIYQDWAKVGFEGLDTVLSFLPKHITKIVENGVTNIKTTLGGK